MHTKRFIIAVLALLAGASALRAQQQPQQPLTPEQREKQLYDNIQQQVDQLALTLELEDWQIFYTDSIFTRNFGDLSQKYEELGKNRISDPAVYMSVQDECMEKNYNALQQILNEKQWAKYLKSGALRAKKARDKRKKS